MTARSSLADVAAVLRKVLAGGRLRRLPRHPERRDILLALICLRMRRRYPYSEVELNKLLLVDLERMDSDVDHVTCRRYLVDLGFVKRDPAGIRYIVNYPKVESTLSPEVIASGNDPFEKVLGLIRKSQ